MTSAPVFGRASLHLAFRCWSVAAGSSPVRTCMPLSHLQPAEPMRHSSSTHPHVLCTLSRDNLHAMAIPLARRKDIRRKDLVSHSLASRCICSTGVQSTDQPRSHLSFLPNAATTSLTRGHRDHSASQHESTGRIGEERDTSGAVCS